MGLPEWLDGEVAGIQARTYAVMLCALDGDGSDVEALLEDLSPEDLASVVHGLASMALLSMLRPEGWRDPVKRAELGRHLRQLLLERQARAEG